MHKGDQRIPDSFQSWFARQPQGNGNQDGRNRKRDSSDAAVSKHALLVIVKHPVEVVALAVIWQSAALHSQSGEQNRACTGYGSSPDQQLGDARSAHTSFIRLSRATNDM